ncbi:MAG: exodeoxyribonuclease VII large subunit [Candidatus Latescibacterota bacterium]|nr:exodeoxyribonuclease VII large subunit [Candidatus Latescibacterota bacterium]
MSLLDLFDKPEEKTEEEDTTPLTVSELTEQVKALLEDGLPHRWIIGELSHYTHHGSGHRYFTLKDETSQLSAVMFKWKSRGLTFEPEVGMKVLVYGNISVYETRGSYQLYAEKMQPAGAGELALSFEKMKSRLAAEGLFDTKHKQPLPAYPRTIGVVTSATGAVIRDIANVLSRRAPGVKIILAPTPVQGPGAAEKITQSIELLNEYNDIDVIIVGRGGGSAEDLWPFNEEIVARAIYDSNIPIISAVGHEVDFSISDYVADHRAPTPSAAAEVVAKEHGAIAQRVVELRNRLRNAVEQELTKHEERQNHLNPQRVLLRTRDKIAQNTQFLDEKNKDLVTAFDRYTSRISETVKSSLTRLDDLSPLQGMERGFSITESIKTGVLIKNSTQLKLGDVLRIRFKQGSIICNVEEIEQ